MNFKYKTKFDCLASLVKGNKSSDSKLSVAALDELNPLRVLAPSDEEIKSNPDLLYIVFNGAVTSLVNLNHDCLDNDTAVAISKAFINKYIDLEHTRTICVGSIVNSGFSTFKDNQIVSPESVSGNYDPHNMSFCGVLWKTVDHSLSEMVEDSNEKDSWMYRKVSASWEIGFNEYKIVRGSRNLNQAEIISDPKEVDRLSKYLVCEGGSGFDDTNTEVYRLISGTVVPLGMGLVRNPAAAVNGVSVIEVELEGQDDEEETTEEFETPEDTFANPDMKESKCSDDDKQKLAELIKTNEILANTIQKFSQERKNIVKARNIMKFKDTESLLEALEVSEASAVTPQMIRQHFEATIDQAAKEYKALEQVKASKEQELNDALEAARNSATELAALANEIKVLKDEAEASKKLSVFQDRMAELAEKYEFNADVQKVIAKQIRDLDEDQYASWRKEDAKVILAAYEKKEQEKEEKTPEEILHEAQASAKHVPNAGDGEQPKQNLKKSWKLGEDFTFNK